MGRKTNIKGAGRDKPDLQLTYWNNWAIFDPITSECLVSFAPAFFKGYSGNLDKICEDIKKYPEQALRDPVILDQIAFVREAEVKKNLPSGSFNKILNAMKIDRRRLAMKVDGALQEYDSKATLEILIPQDLNFFLTMLNREKKRGYSLEEAIYSYIKAVDPEDEDQKALYNYMRIYKAYKKAYEKLIEKLTHKEAIHFFSIAGSNINEPSYYHLWTPEGPKRPIIYAKGQHIIDCHLKKLV